MAGSLDDEGGRTRGSAPTRLDCAVPDFVPVMVVGALCGLVLLAGLLAVLARVF